MLGRSTYLSNNDWFEPNRRQFHYHYPLNVNIMLKERPSFTLPSSNCEAAADRAKVQSNLRQLSISNDVEGDNQGVGDMLRWNQAYDGHISASQSREETPCARVKIPFRCSLVHEIVCKISFMNEDTAVICVKMERKIHNKNEATV